MRFLIAISFLLLITACAEEEKEVVEVIPEITRDWDDIKTDSVLTILAENSPASYFIYRGRNMGYEYELLHEFAKDQNIRLQVQMVNDLDEMYMLLDSCKGDVIACNLTITEERNRLIDFTVPHIKTHQVLIQRKPENYRKLSKQELKDTLIGELEELQGKTIHVWKNSSYYTQITLLNDQLALNMEIIATDGDLITEELIRMVSEGEIDYTIADENVAKIDLRYYSNIDISLKMSQEDSIAFGVRKSSPALRDSLNAWLLGKRKSIDHWRGKSKIF